MKIDLTKKERKTLLKAINRLIDEEQDTISHERLTKKLLVMRNDKTK